MSHGLERRLGRGGAPLPIANFRHVLAVLSDIFFVLNEFFAKRLLGIGAARPQIGDTVNDIAGEMETVEIIENDHVERRSRGAFFFVASYMQVRMVGAPVSKPMNQPRVTMISENDRLVGGKQ